MPRSRHSSHGTLESRFVRVLVVAPFEALIACAVTAAFEIV
jgi:hypothetical protein